MKKEKKSRLLILILACTMVWCGVGQAVGPEPAYVEIKEKMFIAQSNDIYLNPDEYQDKTIRWEGIYTRLDYANADGTPYHCVFRYGPGCCGDDGMVGFEVVWEGDYPEVNSWVQAEGTVEQYDENDITYLRIRLSTLAVQSERGAETVLQ